jgi:predicted helicase
VTWQPLTPDARGNWLPTPEADAFESLLPLGDKERKRAAAGAPQTVFATYSLGVKTNRDAVVYDFDRAALAWRASKPLWTPTTPSWTATAAPCAKARWTLTALWTTAA